jgi:cell wall-active antibiotic response 4TMS protein YvqF
MAQITQSHGRLLTGLILIALGVLFLLDRFHMIRFGLFWEYWWPMGLIAAGLYLLLACRPRRTGWGVVLLVLGVIFQVDRLGFLPWWSADMLWPFALIVTGLWLLLSRLRRPAPPSPTR